MTRDAIGFATVSAATIAAFLGLRWLGADLTPGAAAMAVQATPLHASSLSSVLLAILVVVGSARIAGFVLERTLRQPAVMGEILAGILLGPSLLGLVWPAATAALFPPPVTDALGALANLGVVLFMFVVGLELDLGQLQRSGRVAVAIAQTSIAVPFVAGAGVALLLYPRYAPANVSLSVFLLFFGVSTCVTAFPVLARILTDRGVQHTELGALALGIAAVGDAAAWTLLAFVSGVARSELSGLGWTMGAVAAYLAVMLFVVRPLAARWTAEFDDRPVSRGALAAVLAALLASALATEAAGIHALFGAFFLGAMLPHEGRFAHEVREKLEDLVVVLFLPVFFAATGLKTRIGLLDSPIDAAATVLVVGVATLGKLGGTYYTARWYGLDRTQAGTLGVLMNTRGLMELVVLGVGLDLGIITPRVFAMMVVMAVFTTLITSPLLDLLGGKRAFAT